MMALEACDDGAGNGQSPSTCSFTCKTVHCGNGVLEQGEECDDGGVGGPGNGPGKRCNAACKLNVCGDGDTLLGIEQCDDGMAGTPAKSMTCDTDCTFAVCGDGVINDKAGEDCDDGDKNGTAASTCDSFCHIKGCGNGFLDPTEQCDPNPPGSTGPPVNTSACDRDCTFPVCGDGLPNLLANEDCDNGLANGALCPYGNPGCQTCDLTCHFAHPGGPSCGDGQTNGPELCDQGALNNTLCAYGDIACLSSATSKCTSTCTPAGLLHGPFCGDGTVQAAFEECDPGGNTLTPADAPLCNKDCTFPVCGDGHVNPRANEACDDRNSSACGTCSADCTTQTSSPATGRIIAVAAVGGNITPGDTFTLHDGFTSNTFEFILGAGTTTNLPIVFAANDPAATVAAAIIAAITTEGTVQITARLGTSAATINLTNKRATSLGNQPFNPTGGIATSFTFSTSGAPPVAGMSGGQGGDCDAGVGCSVDDDCTSAKCSRGRCLTCVSNTDCGTGRTCSNGVCSQGP